MGADLTVGVFTSMPPSTGTAPGGGTMNMMGGDLWGCGDIIACEGDALLAVEVGKKGRDSVGV